MMAVPIALAAAFNLVCTGTTTTYPKDGDATDKPFAQTYRVDLDRRRWCEGVCEYTIAIDRIDATVVTFVDSTTDLGSTLKLVNRETGGLAVTVKVPWKTEMSLGKCQVAPFSGFPARKF